MSQDLLRIDHLHFAWPGAAALFTDFSASLGPGLTWLLGDENSGKSTLLALTAGLMPAHSGRLSIAGCSLHDAPQRYRAQVFHAPAPSPALDAQTVSGYLASLGQCWPRLDADWLQDLLDGLSLRDHLNKQIHMLSTGTRRKLWTTAALACGAPLALLDQPFASLDRLSCDFLVAEMQDLRQHPDRAWWVADYAAEASLADAPTIRLDAAG